MLRGGNCKCWVDVIDKLLQISCARLVAVYFYQCAKYYIWYLIKYIVTILPARVSNVYICIYCQMVKIIEDMCIIVSVHIWRCSTLFFIKPGVGQMLQLQHTLQL